MKKEGPLYDLPILIALLCANGQLTGIDDTMAFIGELSLDGTLRRINGVLPMVLCAKKKGIEKIFIPAENINEGAVVEGIEVYPVKSVLQLINHITGIDEITPVTAKDYNEYRHPDNLPDFSKYSSLIKLGIITSSAFALFISSLTISSIFFKTFNPIGI